MNAPYEQVSNAKQHPAPELNDPTHDIPPELAPRIKAAAARAGMRYESFTQQLLRCAFAHVTFWQQSDLERLFWLADRLGLDPLERDLIALEQKEPFPVCSGRVLPVLGLCASGQVSIAVCMRAGSIIQDVCCATRHSPNAQGLPLALAGAFGLQVVSLKAASLRKPKPLGHLISTNKKAQTPRQTQPFSGKL